MKTVLRLSLPAGLILSCMTPFVSAAQTGDSFARDRNASVSQRPHPEYEALGLRFGSFRVYPSFQVDGGYSSNVLATDTDESSDTFYRLLPKVEVESDWGRHSITATLQSSTTRYQDLSSEDSDTWDAGLTGRYDVSRNAQIIGGVDYSSQVESRTSSNRPDLLVQPEYTVLSSYLGFSQTFNRLKTTGRVDAHAYNFKDGTSLTGVEISQADRDQTTYEGLGRVDYALSPATAIFAAVTLNDRQFDQGSVGTPNRGSSGYSALVGANFELSSLVRGEIGVGYLQQDYDSAVYGSFSGATANVRLEYFASPLLTLGLRANRSIEDSGIPGTAGYLTTVVETTADYELRRNVLVGARFGRELEELDVIDRENERYYGGVKATYLVNRRLGLTASYDYEDRNSTGVNAINDFTAHRVYLSVVAQY